jgi:hypothetical protein
MSQARAEAFNDQPYVVRHHIGAAWNAQLGLVVLRPLRS